jgi:hypothetical protein
MAIKAITGQRYTLAVESGTITTFRFHVFESEEDQIGYFLTSRGKRSDQNPLVKNALAALSELWPQPGVSFTADDKDRQILSISAE